MVGSIPLSAHHVYATAGIGLRFARVELGVAVGMEVGEVDCGVVGSSWGKRVSCRCGNPGEGVVALCCML